MGQSRESLKHLLNGFLGLFGKELRSRSAPLHTFAQGLQELKRKVAIASVIDIGVADGTPELYREFKGYPMLLVEANPHYSARLDELATTLPARVEKVFCGAQAGTVPLRLYTSGRKASSYKTHSNEIEATYTGTTDVPVRTLDSMVGALPKPYLIKIDAEGAELEVLRGAEQAVQGAGAIILEASVVERYAGAPQLAELVGYMKEKGFSVYDMIEGSIEDGRMLMVDLVFVPTAAAFRKL